MDTKKASKRKMFVFVIKEDKKCYTTRILRSFRTDVYILTAKKILKVWNIN